MKEKLFLTGMLVLALTLGVLAAGCDNGGDSEGDNGGYETEDLPASVGANAVGGKTYFPKAGKIEFSVTADGESSGTYRILHQLGYTYPEGKTGAYSWNETAKTITLKPERVALAGTDGYGPLEDKTASRVSMQAVLNLQREQWGEEKFNRYLSSFGSSSIDAYLDYEVAETFAKETYNYTFSTDNTVLFLDRVLPAKKGANQLNGQTYNGRQYNDDYSYTKNTGQVYTFTASDYTYTNIDTGASYLNGNHSGTYTYDSAQKRFWLKPSISDRQTEYDELVSSSGWSVDDVAGEINERYKIGEYTYDTTDKTIVRIR
jgi:hypothetical protein